MKGHCYVKGCEDFSKISLRLDDKGEGTGFCDAHLDEAVKLARSHDLKMREVWVEYRCKESDLRSALFLSWRNIKE